MRRLNIQNDNSLHNPSFGGMYRYKNDEKTYFLTHPQASTLRLMVNHNTEKEQFEIFCMGYLWIMLDNWLRKPEFKKSFDLFVKYSKKFDIPWQGNARHVLPIISWANPLLLSKKGIYTKALRKEFEKFADYEFVLFG
ncbi:hypothetical protein KGQ27_02615 [Patescibacteria group bacterium]|nr:hypothetical protein [Patescibacteria group bacterium]MDE1946460.1 hypothetical protein [Patescibacteria group bacterium]MDE2011067.1 hypothetical protein [Patescibacteria group bacterium]